MPPLPKAITFDCYGTLIDWEGDIQRFFVQQLASKQITSIDARALQRHGETRPSDVKETFLVGDLATLVYLIKGISAISKMV